MAADALASDKFDFEKATVTFGQIMDSNEYSAKQKQQAIENVMANDKFTWQQKQDLIQNELDRTKLDSAQSNDTPTSYKEWALATNYGANGDSYSKWLLDKGGKAPTANQSTSAGYTMRMKSSMDTINNLTSWYTSQNLLGQAFNTLAPSFLKSAEGQMIEQAQRDFINAKLRQESGAVISPTEFDNAKKQYFPQPGDTAEVIAQKQRNMTTALKGMVQQSGSALSDDFVKNIEKVNYNSVSEYKTANPTGYESLKSQVPEIEKTLGRTVTEQDLMQLINSDFNNEGSDSQNALKDIFSYNTGDKGGQCGVFVNKTIGMKVGQGLTDKINNVDKYGHVGSQGIKVGDVIVQNIGNYGHVAIVNSINPDGTITLSESNYNKDEKVNHSRKISLDSPRIYGYIRPSEANKLSITNNKTKV